MILHPEMDLFNVFDDYWHHHFGYDELCLLMVFKYKYTQIAIHYVQIPWYCGIIKTKKSTRNW